MFTRGDRAPHTSSQAWLQAIYQILRLQPPVRHVSEPRAGQCSPNSRNRQRRRILASRFVKTCTLPFLPFATRARAMPSRAAGSTPQGVSHQEFRSARVCLTGSAFHKTQDRVPTQTADPRAKDLPVSEPRLLAAALAARSQRHVSETTLVTCALFPLFLRIAARTRRKTTRLHTRTLLLLLPFLQRDKCPRGRPMQTTMYTYAAQ